MSTICGFADVVDVSFHGGEDELAAAGLTIGSFHEFFQVGDRGLHDFRGLEHEGGAAFGSA